ncbi:hypothetical protein [Sphingomonas sp.]|uniref:hypothetical protein n=1 Tax=Sphingomonas sp. TaxID=28214 RepID=UPI002DD63C82|nr:hypothetical protein [Sphingomonas sp.]
MIAVVHHPDHVAPGLILYRFVVAPLTVAGRRAARLKKRLHDPRFVLPWVTTAPGLESAATGYAGNTE